MLDSIWELVIIILICLFLGTVLGYNLYKSTLTDISKGSQANILILDGYEYKVILEKIQPVPK